MFWINDFLFMFSGDINYSHVCHLKLLNENVFIVGVFFFSSYFGVVSWNDVWIDHQNVCNVQTRVRPILSHKYTDAQQNEKSIEASCMLCVEPISTKRIYHRCIETGGSTSQRNDQAYRQPVFVRVRTLNTMRACVYESEWERETEVDSIWSNARKAPTHRPTMKFSATWKWTSIYDETHAAAYSTLTQRKKIQKINRRWITSDAKAKCVLLVCLSLLGERYALTFALKLNRNEESKDRKIGECKVLCDSTEASLLACADNFSCSRQMFVSIRTTATTTWLRPTSSTVCRHWCRQSFFFSFVSTI